MNYGAQCSLQGAGHHQNMPCPTVGITLHLWSSRIGCFTPFYAERCFVCIDHRVIEHIRWRSKTSTDFTLDQWIKIYLITIKFTLVDLRDFKLHFIKHMDNFYPVKKWTPDFPLLKETQNTGFLEGDLVRNVESISPFRSFISPVGMQLMGKQSQSVSELMSMGHSLHVKPEVLETLEQVTQSCTLPAPPHPRSPHPTPELTFLELKMERAGKNERGSAHCVEAASGQ